MTEYYILIAMLGLATGSFLNVCIYRIPKGDSIATPRSHCMKCGQRLKLIDLIPVLSSVVLKFKCRYCGERFSPRYALVELLTAGIFSALFYRYGITVEFAAFAFIMSVLTAVFFIDLDHRIIPDGLVVTGLAGGAIIIVYNIFYSFEIFGDRVWWNPLLGMVTGSGILFIIALIGIAVYKSDDAMGMGDVKIFAPIGIFLGWKMTLLALVIAVAIAGTAGLLLIITRLKNRKDGIPFGPFIVTAAFIAIMWGWEIWEWYAGRIS